MEKGHDLKIGIEQGPLAETHYKKYFAYKQMWAFFA